MSSHIVVMGGGPAGCTLAILLAKAGYQVTLFEKDQHPRYHIGESGILSLPTLLKLLDLKERVEALGSKRKGGVFFDWNERWCINWGESGQYTYHVIRSEFDHLLIQRAKECGVKVYENTQVLNVNFESGHPKSVEVKSAEKKWSARCDYLVDATGRNAILARRYFHSQVPLEAFQNVAVWGYWMKSLSPHTLEGFKSADGYHSQIQNPIVLSSVPHGWIWGIPLHNQTLSVGVVLQQKEFLSRKKQLGLKELYLEALKSSDVFSHLLKPALLLPQIRQTQDWSYRTTFWAGNRTFLVGDSAVFIDPLLSTGMTSGMLSAVSAAACIIELEKNEYDAKEIYDFYASDYEKRFWRLSFVIGALYGAKSHPEDLFHKTHTLTSKDLFGGAYEDIRSSFSSVISGMEDLKEASAADLQRIASKRIRNNFSKELNTIPKLPDLAPSALELSLAPLGLKKSLVAT